MRHASDVCIGAGNRAERRAAMAMGRGKRLTGQAAEQAIRTAMAKNTGLIRRGLQTWVKTPDERWVEVDINRVIAVGLSDPALACGIPDANDEGHAAGRPGDRPVGRDPARTPSHPPGGVPWAP